MHQIVSKDKAGRIVASCGMHKIKSEESRNE
jgi:hypothetical protein